MDRCVCVSLGGCCGIQGGTGRGRVTGTGYSKLDAQPHWPRDVTSGTNQNRQAGLGMMREYRPAGKQASKQERASERANKCVLRFFWAPAPLTL